MAIKMLTKLTRRMDEYSETENIRKIQTEVTELKNKTTELKNIVEGFNNRLENLKIRLVTWKNKVIEFTQVETQKEKRVLKMKIT